jgi:hypothetical protein
VGELIETYPNASTANIMVLLGGDFDAGPDTEEGSPY